LHSGNIFSYTYDNSEIGDLGLCQQIVDKKDNPNKIFGVIPYLAPEVLSKKPYTKESDIYSLGMIMWELTTGKKPFHDRSHDQYLMLDILNGERPQITDDTPEFYAEFMKRCWDRDPENRPTAKEIYEFF
jgi:serine/threonine protein kinase